MPDPRDRMTPEQRKWYDDGWQAHYRKLESTVWWSGWWAGAGITTTIVSVVVMLTRMR